MKAIRISMTDWQIRMIQPMITKLEDEYDKGNYSALWAQVVVEIDYSAYLDIRLLDNKQCIEIQKIVGQQVGKQCDSKIPVSVYVPENDN